MARPRASPGPGPRCRVVLNRENLYSTGVKIALNPANPGFNLENFVLFILLICFRLRRIPPQLVEEASNRLLFVLPALFIPIYVSAIGQGQLWLPMSWVTPTS